MSAPELMGDRHERTASRDTPEGMAANRDRKRTAPSAPQRGTSPNNSPAGTPARSRPRHPRQANRPTGTPPAALPASPTPTAGATDGPAHDRRPRPAHRRRLKLDRVDSGRTPGEAQPSRSEGARATRKTASTSSALRDHNERSYAAIERHATQAHPPRRPPRADRAHPMSSERAEWLDWRRGGIGSSDIAAIIGLSPGPPRTAWGREDRPARQPRQRRHRQGVRPPPRAVRPQVGPPVNDLTSGDWQHADPPPGMPPAAADAHHPDAQLGRPGDSSAPCRSTGADYPDGWALSLSATSLRRFAPCVRRTPGLPWVKPSAVQTKRESGRPHGSR